MVRKYSVDNVKVEDLLAWINQGRVGLPEMQRPFVWSSTKVRDLIDSLYNGYPIGYIVTWLNPAAKLKNDSDSNNKEIIIDGQQRLTALKAALNGDEVIDKHYKRERIKISFKPSEEIFATRNVATEKDPRWIDDISLIFQPGYNSWKFVDENADRLGTKKSDLGNVLQKVKDISQCEIGNISLSDELSIDAVTNIFNRINSKGVTLSSADLAMSRLSADHSHNGNNIRKQIDYFVQLFNDPTLLTNIEDVDPEFINSKYFDRIKWIVFDKTRIYVPNYSDILHVILAFTYKRGKLTDLVSLISGRNFQTRDFSEQAMDENYQKLLQGASQVFSKLNFQRFTMILRDLGMRNSGKLGLVGYGTLNFAYILYLYLQCELHLSKDKIDSLVKRWVVMSALTGRYSGSSESAIERDIKAISQSGDPVATMKTILGRELTDNFWSITLPEALQRQTTQTSSWRIFQMSQVYSGDRAWLAKDTRAETVMEEEGNIHHIFPRAYLRANNFSKAEINQIANYVWLTRPRNLNIGDRAPKDYLHDSQISQFLNEQNNAENAIPADLPNYDFHNYHHFLEQRRQLMAEKIHHYYDEL
ncbi:GmrSD restriction endonuclease domain-containing protein [Limosilactobacillus avium]|uniref:GmrSD restriction endonuclease domain-containing protein n=1 Tax=Limosilactobacillus avium TaxID=2991831 RepID=UPI0024BB4E13|nr:DUF262 domain-containing protein [Limosilactobacillus avium]